MLVLRKSMFNRELDARLVGLVGSAQLLRAFNSKAALSSDKERLRLELLGFLRKCLTQQAEVREELYAVLPEVVRATPSVHEAAFGLLAPQLSRYLVLGAQNPGEPPVQLSKCLEKVAASELVVVHEPLPQLLLCMLQCLDVHRRKEGSAATDPASAAALVQQQLSTLTTRILKSELEDFELDKSSDYSDTLMVLLAFFLLLPSLSLSRQL